MHTLARPFILAIYASACVLASGAVCAGDDAQAWHTVEGVRRQLEQPISISWSGVPLRQALQNLARSQRVAIVLDRRVIPDQEIELTLRDVPLNGALLRIAAKLGLGVGRAGPVIYLGPVAAADRLQTLVELRRQEVGRLPQKLRSEVSAQKPYKWNALSTPSELLEETARDYGVRIEPPAGFPHDLWPACELPSVGLVERVSLIAVHFDLTFEISSNGRVLLVPMPERVVLERSYPASTPAVTAGRLKEILKRSEVTSDDGKVIVRGPAEEHDMAADLLSGKKVRQATATPGKTVYQLNIVMPVGRLIQELAPKLDLRVEIDERAIDQAGLSLEKDVNVSVKDASREDLLKAVLEPAGLTYSLDGNSILVRPK